MTNKKPSNLKKSTKYYATIGAGILGIAFVHFGLQMTYIQKENLRSYESAVETNKIEVPQVEENIPAEQTVEIKPEQFAIKEIEVIKNPEITKTVPRRQAEPVAPEKRVVKQKEATETRTERIRRAEKILTGI